MMMKVMRGELLKLEDQLVSVHSGVAWITRKGAPGDYVLKAGQRMPLHGKGWVVQSLSSGEGLCFQEEPLAKSTKGGRSKAATMRGMGRLRETSPVRQRTKP